MSMKKEKHNNKNKYTNKLKRQAREALAMIAYTLCPHLK